MKVTIPTRGFQFLIAFLFAFSFSSFLSGQDCDNCSTSTVDISMCGSDGNGTFSFDLDAGVMLLNPTDNTVVYRTACSSGTQSGDEINSPYSISASETIYAFETNDDSGMDTCVQVIEVNLIVLTVTISPLSGTVCSSASPIALTATAVGGAGTLSYQWKRGSTEVGSNSATYNATEGGMYTVEVNDGQCTATSNSAEIDEPNFSGTITSSAGNNFVCDDESSVTLTANPDPPGVNGTYTYAWTQSGGAGSTGQTRVTDDAATYNVEITETASGCSIDVGPFVLTDRSLSGPTYSNQQNPSCLGEMDGQFDVSVSNGSGNYTYTATGGGSTSSNSDGEFRNLAPGTYMISVSDNEAPSCSTTGSVMLSPGRTVTIGLVGMDPTVSMGSDGEIDVNMTGMADYHWTLTGDDNKSGVSSTPSFTIGGLSAGDYVVTVKDDDNNGCSISDNVTLDDVVCMIEVPSAIPTAPDCNGQSTGTILVTINNPSGNYDVSWSGTAGNSDLNQNGGTHLITGLAAGTYSITVEDSAECIDNIQNITVDPAPAITFSSSQLRGACSGVSNGTIRVSNFNNGNGPYTVTWNGPVSSSGSTAGGIYDIINLPAGDYSISVMDAQMCSAPSNPQQVSVSPIPNPTVIITGDLTFCDGDGANTLATNPDNFSSYSWSTGSGSPTISVNNPGANQVASYGVTVTNSDGCSGSVQSQVNGLAPTTISLNAGASKTSVTCNSSEDGAININISGGNEDYNFSWTGPDGYTSSLGDISNLSPGDYTLNVTDGEGCTGSFSQTISVPSAITAVAIPTEVSCNGDTDGVIQVTAQGGTAPLEYEWSSPVPSSNTSAIATNLPAGSYTITITDANDCFIIETATVTEPNEVIASISPGDPQVCIGDEITLLASGGTSYEWSGGQGINQSITVGPSTTTSYTVTVTDAATKNCTGTTTIDVTVNPLPVIGITIDESSGNTNDDGTLCEEDEVTLTASGGASYTWTGGNLNPYNFTPPLGTSSYTVTVTDANNCVNTKTEDLLVNLNPIADFEFDAASQIVEDQQNIENTSQALCGELVDCTWTVEDLGTFNDCEGISPTFLTQGGKDILLTVENSCGCVDSTPKVLEIGKSDQCAIIEFTLNRGETSACVNEEVDIRSDARPSGETCTLGAFAYEVIRGGAVMTNGNQYNFLASAGKFTFNEEGSYEVTLTINDGSACGCVKSATRMIDIIGAPDIAFAADNPTVGCEGETIEISFGAYDSEDRITVMFDDGSTQPYENPTFEFSPNALGISTLEIISIDNGICEVPVSGEVLEIDILPEFKIVSEMETDCDENLRFSYSVTVEGGDPSVPLSVEGISGGNILDGTTFEIGGLEPNKDYSFTLSKGNTCEPILIDIRKTQCNCTFDVGDNVFTEGFEGCENTVFNIEGIFTTADSEFNPSTDTLIFVLHQSGGGLSLGKAFVILPADAQTLSSDFSGFTPDFPYSLSVVGLKKASLEDGEIVLGDPDNISFLGENDCLSVVNGIPVLWRPTPTPTIGSNDGNNFICRNAYDFPVFANNTQDGSDVTFEVLGLGSENIKFYGFQDTAFIYFEDDGRDSFQVVVTESKTHTDGAGESYTCTGSDTIVYYVLDGDGAPPLSEIILWPGNILVSTADSSTTCFQWGFYRGKTQIEFTDKGNSKFYFAANDADIINDGDIYYVDTYFCDNPDCVTRVFFNNDGPIPGLIFKEEETFQYIIKPNPNDGRFTLNLFSKVKGRYLLELFDSTGKNVHAEERDLEIDSNDVPLDMQHLSRGIYFIRILDKTSGNYSTDKVIIN